MLVGCLLILVDNICFMGWTNCSSNQEEVCKNPYEECKHQRVIENYLKDLKKHCKVWVGKFLHIYLLLMV